MLPVPKLFFGYARDLTAALFPFGVGGAGIVFPERTSPERIFELVERHRPSILVQVPTMMAAMIAHPDAAQHDLLPRLCTSAGEALPRELYDRWQATFGVEALDGIGSSEAYHIYISNRPGRVRPGSVGEVVPAIVPACSTTRAEVPDGDGNPLDRGDRRALLLERAREEQAHVPAATR